MRNNGTTTKHAVFFYLLLHTTVIVMLAFLLTRGRFVSNHPGHAMAVVVGSVAFMLYTAHIIVRSVDDEIAYREKEISKTSIKLQATLKAISEYEKELGRRTLIFQECGQELERRAGMMNEYSERINELISTVPLLDKDEA